MREANSVIWQASAQRLLISIKDAEDDNGAVFFDGKMDNVGEGVDGLDPDVIVADGRSQSTSNLWVRVPDNSLLGEFLPHLLLK
jgi:hypothetical protein